jgi:acyl-coenzyme A thioesterase PaaI-like protein
MPLPLHHETDNSQYTCVIDGTAVAVIRTPAPRTSATKLPPASTGAGTACGSSSIPSSTFASAPPTGASTIIASLPPESLVYNHLHTVHAIASCSAAEIAMGMLMEATVPTSHRWIPKAMNVQYLEKATTSLRAQARLATPDFTSITEGTEIVVPVSVVDKSGTEVVHADITTWVTPAD